MTPNYHRLFETNAAANVDNAIPMDIEMEAEVAPDNSVELCFLSYRDWKTTYVLWKVTQRQLPRYPVYANTNGRTHSDTQSLLQL